MTFCWRINPNHTKALLYVFRCKLCPSRFVQQHDLTRHVAICHQKNLSCKICSKKFGQKSVLTTHLKTVHQRAKDFPCSKCELQFGTNSSLKRHFIAKHNLDISVQNPDPIFVPTGNLSEDPPLKTEPFEIDNEDCCSEFDFSEEKIDIKFELE